MESKFFNDAVFFGFTTNAIKLGTILTLGEFWVRPSGCHTVYRGQDGIIDYDDIQAVMDVTAADVTISNQALPPNTIWSYIRRQCSDCGLESPDSPTHKIVINSEGTMILSTPNNVQDLTIEPLAGGIMQLRWRYFATGQEVVPTGFKIFIDSGSGFDFTTPYATVVYRRAVEHKWKSSALTHGQTYKFCVRSYTTAAGETINTNFVAAKADSVGPAAAVGASVSWEEV